MDIGGCQGWEEIRKKVGQFQFLVPIKKIVGLLLFLFVSSLRRRTYFTTFSIKIPNSLRWESCLDEITNKYMQS